MKKIILSIIIILLLTINFSNFQFLNSDTVAAKSNDVETNDINLTKTIDEDGIVHAELTTPQENAKIIFNPKSGETYLNDKLIKSKYKWDKNEEGAITPYANLPIGSGGSVYLGTYYYDIPVGTTINTAAALITIWTGLPTSKIAQTIIVLTGVSLTRLDSLLDVEVREYRTAKKVQEAGMCYPQYKHKTYSNLIYKGKHSNTTASGWYLTSKPC